MENFLNTSHPVRCIITGPSECGKSVFLTNLFLCIFNEFHRTHKHSPGLREDL